MSFRIARLIIPLVAAVSLTACSTVIGPNVPSSSPSEVKPGDVVIETSEAASPSSQEPEFIAGFEEQPGPDENLCESVNFSDLDPFVPNREGFIMSHRTDVLECTSNYQSDYMASVKSTRDDLREESETRAIYLTVVAIDDMNPNFAGYRETVGEKSGQKIFVQDKFQNGRPGLVQAHSFIGDDWHLTLEVNSVLTHPPVGDELFAMIVDSMDTIFSDEMNNSKLRDATGTPMKKPESRDEPGNAAEETVNTGLKGMLAGDQITAADYFVGGAGEDQINGWRTRLFEELSAVGEGDCEFAITYSSYSNLGSWYVVTDVSLCPVLYKDFLREGGFKESAFVAWAVKKFPEIGDNYAVWARGDAGASASDAILALEMNTADEMPWGWTSSDHTTTEPTD